MFRLLTCRQSTGPRANQQETCASWRGQSRRRTRFESELAELIGFEPKVRPQTDQGSGVRHKPMPDPDLSEHAIRHPVRVPNPGDHRDRNRVAALVQTLRRILRTAAGRRSIPRSLQRAWP